jgi:hypothetical protein
MSINLTPTDLRELLALTVGWDCDPPTDARKRAIAAKLEAALTPTPRVAKGPTGKGHAHCVYHAPMPAAESLTGKWLCWAGKAPNDRELKARVAFVAEVERSAAAARKRWASRPAPDGKLAWLDGKRVKPSGLRAARDKHLGGKPPRDYAVNPGDLFITKGNGAWTAPDYREMARYRSKLVSTRRRSRKTVIRVTARA